MDDAIEVEFSFDGEDEPLFQGIALGECNGFIVPNVDRDTAQRMAAHYNARHSDGTTTLAFDGDVLTSTTTDEVGLDVLRFEPENGRYTIDLEIPWIIHRRLSTGILATPGDQIIYLQDRTIMPGRVLGVVRSNTQDQEGTLSYRIINRAKEIVEISIEEMLQSVIAPRRLADLDSHYLRMFNGFTYVPGEDVGFALGDDDTILTGTYLGSPGLASEHVVRYAGATHVVTNLIALVTHPETDGTAVHH